MCPCFDGFPFEACASVAGPLVPTNASLGWLALLRLGCLMTELARCLSGDFISCRPVPVHLTIQSPRARRPSAGFAGMKVHIYRGLCVSCPACTSVPRMLYFCDILSPRFVEQRTRIRMGCVARRERTRSGGCGCRFALVLGHRRRRVCRSRLADRTRGDASQLFGVLATRPFAQLAARSWPSALLLRLTRPSGLIACV